VRIWRLFKQHFLLGLLAVAPIAITTWILVQFYGLVNRTVRPILLRIPELTESFPDFFLTLIAFLCFLAMVALVGLFARNLAGRAFFNLLERGLDRIPLIKSVFSSTKQLAEVFFSDQRSAFREVVLFEYPRRGSFSLGFVTSASPTNGLVSVFLPTTPNPTTGFLLLMPRNEVAATSLTVEQGVRLIITGGASMTAAQAALLRENVDHLRGSSPATREETP
jgi:uncharacterized membrane protein